jgi:Uncharacterized conserved protein
MVLHLIKLAVGVDDLAHMKKLQANRRKQRASRRARRTGSIHGTRRAAPRNCWPAVRSIGWCAASSAAATELVGFDEDFDKEEAHKYCKIKVKRTIIRTAPRACRAFQGWRYFKPGDAPPDLSKGDTGDMPQEMADELKRLGLL